VQWKMTERAPCRGASSDRYTSQRSPSASYRMATPVLAFSDRVHADRIAASPVPGAGGGAHPATRPHGRSRLPRPRWAAAAGLAGLLLVAACDPEPAGRPQADDAPAPVPSPTANNTPAAGADRPETRTDTLLLEGMPEPVELRLIRAGQGPLPFSTYVPPDMQAEVTEEGAVARFTAAFAGRPRADAFLEVYLFPPGTGPEQAVASARDYLPGQLGADAPRTGRFEGEEEAQPATLDSFVFTYRRQGQDYTGSIAVLRAAGRLVRVVQHYPAEMGDGFGPRTEMILRHWQWADGSRLQQ
jgi:hypothetical protein